MRVIVFVCVLLFVCSSVTHNIISQIETDSWSFCRRLTELLVPTTFRFLLLAWKFSFNYDCLCRIRVDIYIIYVFIWNIVILILPWASQLINFLNTGIYKIYCVVLCYTVQGKQCCCLNAHLQVFGHLSSTFFWTFLFIHQFKLYFIKKSSACYIYVTK